MLEFFSCYRNECRSRHIKEDYLEEEGWKDGREVKAKEWLQELRDFATVISVVTPDFTPKSYYSHCSLKYYKASVSLIGVNGRHNATDVDDCEHCSVEQEQSLNSLFDIALYTIIINHHGLTLDDSHISF